MRISLVAAVAVNGVIGLDGRLPWHIPEDLRLFRELTTGHTVITGRRTYESIGRPLPDRRMIVLSRNRSFRAEGCTVVAGLDEALALCAGEDEVFVIGGAQLFAEAMPLAERIYFTRIDRSYEGDTFFPPIPPEFHVTAERALSEDPPATLFIYDRR